MRTLVMMSSNMEDENGRHESVGGGLATVLEVPLPDESSKYFSPRCRSGLLGRNSMKSWVRSRSGRLVLEKRSSSFNARRGADVQLMLGVIGAPLVSQPVEPQPHGARSISWKGLNEEPIATLMAKYIVHQYVAAAGGETALRAVQSMYAMGKVRMKTSDFQPAMSGGNADGESSGKKSSAHSRAGEMGGFVVWQKGVDLWCIELVLSGCKITAGSDGKVAWRQTPWQPAHASRGHPRPLRRCVQGLDPKTTADLFRDAMWVGEKCIHGEDCFVLRVDTAASALRARSSAAGEVFRHTVWGYFSQRTGLLVQLDDSHLLKIPGGDVDSKKCRTSNWETYMSSFIHDYRAVDGVNIAHAGRTTVSLCRSGGDGSCTRSFMEETWTIEEVDFNIVGLSLECFLPPRDLVVEDEDENTITNTTDTDHDDDYSNAKVIPPAFIRANKGNHGGCFLPVLARVSAVDSDQEESSGSTSSSEEADGEREITV